MMDFVVLLLLLALIVFVVVVVNGSVVVDVVEFLLRIARQKRNRMLSAVCSVTSLIIEALIGPLGLPTDHPDAVLCIVVVLARIISFVGFARIIILLINIHGLVRQLLPLDFYAFDYAQVTEAQIQVETGGTADVVVVVEAAAKVERLEVEVQGRINRLVLGCRSVVTTRAVQAFVGSCDRATAESFLEVSVGFAREVLGRVFVVVVPTRVRCMVGMVTEGGDLPVAFDRS